MGVAELLAQRKAALAEKNKQDGKVFWEQNKADASITTCPSGLQYRILQMGQGPIVQAGQQVVCHYEGRNLAGEIFDSSYTRNQPSTFSPEKLIAGFREALYVMPVGSCWEVYIPSDLAYGEEHKSKEIGANSTLVFKIELLAVVE